MSTETYLTKEQAREEGLIGWNCRCNLCGSFGALWVPGGRPGWGSLALCTPHREEWNAEMQRHDKEMQRLRTINFEQEPQPSPEFYDV